MPVIQRFIAVYKIWDELRNNFPKKSRYKLGVKIDELFLDTIELLFMAGSLGRAHKLPALQKASGKLDLLKFFMQMSWEIKILNDKKYIILSSHLSEIGKMLGGWKKHIENKTSAV